MAKPRIMAVTQTTQDEIFRMRGLIDHHRGEFTLPWQLGDEADADFVLVDIDSVYGHMGWLKARGNGRICAVYTSAPHPKESELFLRKPASGSELIDLLNHVGAHLPAAPAPIPAATPARKPAVVHPIPSAPSRADVPRATAPAAAMSNPEHAAHAPEHAAHAPVAAMPRPEAVVPAPLHAAQQAVPEAPQPGPQHLHIDDFLLGVEALTGPVRLSTDGLPPLVLHPAQKTWHAPQGLKAIGGWCTRVLTHHDFRPISEAELALAASTHPAQPYARLLWLARLVRGRGHLDPGLDPNARYKLARWPQSEREFPKHFRIATVMMKQPLLLGEIAEQSGAALADVVDFINGYYAIGFVESESTEETATDVGRGGNLLARLRKPFGT